MNESTLIRAGDVALGSGAATLPWWAAQSQLWIVYVGAVAGAVLAILRLIQFAVDTYKRWRGRHAE